MYGTPCLPISQLQSKALLRGVLRPFIKFGSEDIVSPSDVPGSQVCTVEPLLSSRVSGGDIRKSAISKSKHFSKLVAARYPIAQTWRVDLLDSPAPY